MQMAPVAIFCFNRPDKLRELLSSLSVNKHFFESPLYFFCDAPRGSSEIMDVNATRKVALDFQHSHKTVKEAETNLGLARSLREGITQVVEKHGKIIVLEDDLVVVPEFLEFMNASLNKFSGDERIMQVSGFMFGSDVEFEEPLLFFPNITTWGWGTWSRAWSHFDPEATGWQNLLDHRVERQNFNLQGQYDYTDILLQQVSGALDSWGILWNWSVFKRDGLVVYPSVSFVENKGFDGSGIHCRSLTLTTAITQTESITRVLNELKRNIIIKKSDITMLKSSMRELNGSLVRRLLKSIRSSIRRLEISVRT